MQQFLVQQFLVQQFLFEVIIETNSVGLTADKMQLLMRYQNEFLNEKGDRNDGWVITDF